GIFAELQERRFFYAEHVYNALRGIRSGGSPVRSTLITRHRNGASKSRRRKQALIPRAEDLIFNHAPLFVRDIWTDVVHGKLLARKRRRRCWKRLRRPGMLALHVALRYFPLFDRPHRLSREPIEHIEETGLACQSDRFNRFAVLFDRDQLRGRNVV